MKLTALPPDFSRFGDFVNVILQRATYLPVPASASASASASVPTSTPELSPEPSTKSQAPLVKVPSSARVETRTWQSRLPSCPLNLEKRSCIPTNPPRVPSAIASSGNNSGGKAAATTFNSKPKSKPNSTGKPKPKPNSSGKTKRFQLHTNGPTVTIIRSRGSLSIAGQYQGDMSPLSPPSSPSSSDSLSTSPQQPPPDTAAPEEASPPLSLDIGLDQKHTLTQGSELDRSSHDAPSPLPRPEINTEQEQQHKEDDKWIPVAPVIVPVPSPDAETYCLPRPASAQICESRIGEEIARLLQHYKDQRPKQRRFPSPRLLDTSVRQRDYYSILSSLAATRFCDYKSLGQIKTIFAHTPATNEWSPELQVHAKVPLCKLVGPPNENESKKSGETSTSTSTSTSTAAVYFCTALEEDKHFYIPTEVLDPWIASFPDRFVYSPDTKFGALGAFDIFSFAGWDTLELVPRCPAKPQRRRRRKRQGGRIGKRHRA